ETWLRGWRERSGTLTLAEAIDRLVAEKMAEHSKAVRSLPDPESVAESVSQLLEQCRTLDPAYGLSKVDRLEKARSGKQPPYPLPVQQRGPQDTAEVRTGLVFVLTSSPVAMFHVLDRLIDDEHPPQRVLLIADENGLDVGTKGEEYLEQLRKRPNYHLEELRLPLADFATLDALHAVWNLAKNEDIELRMRDGTNRLISAKEVEQSHHRQDRYRQAPVLSEVLTLPTTVTVQSVEATISVEEADDVLVLDEP